MIILAQFLCSPCKWELTLPSGGGVVSCRERLNYGHLMPDRELLTYFSSVPWHQTRPYLTHCSRSPSPYKGVFSSGSAKEGKDMEFWGEIWRRIRILTAKTGLNTNLIYLFPPIIFPFKGGLWEILSFRGTFLHPGRIRLLGK